MKIKLFVLLSLFLNCAVAQTAVLNGLELNGPKGFEKSGDFTWTQGINAIHVMSVKAQFTDQQIQDLCEHESRSTKYLRSHEIEISGHSYLLCFFQKGDYEMRGQVIVYRDGYTYLVTVRTCTRDCSETGMFDDPYEQAGYMMGYMIAAIIMQ
jgi:hypothetical protein